MEMDEFLMDFGRMFGLILMDIEWLFDVAILAQAILAQDSKS